MDDTVINNKFDKIEEKREDLRKELEQKIETVRTEQRDTNTLLFEKMDGAKDAITSFPLGEMVTKMEDYEKRISTLESRFWKWLAAAITSGGVGGSIIF